MRRRGIPKAVPKVGDEIYVRTSLSLGHGMTDVEGGLAKVTNVTEGMSAGKMVPFVEVEELPGKSYNWQILSRQQDELRVKHGQERAHHDPDYRPELNPRF